MLQLDEGTTLADLLEELDIKRRVVMSVNGDHEPDQSRRLRDGDRVMITSSISGGMGALPLDQSRGRGE